MKCPHCGYPVLGVTPNRYCLDCYWREWEVSAHLDPDGTVRKLYLDKVNGEYMVLAVHDLTGMVMRGTCDLETRPEDIATVRLSAGVDTVLLTGMVTSGRLLECESWRPE